MTTFYKLHESNAYGTVPSVVTDFMTKVSDSDAGTDFATKDDEANKLESAAVKARDTATVAFAKLLQSAEATLSGGGKDLSAGDHYAIMDAEDHYAIMDAVEEAARGYGYENGFETEYEFGKGEANFWTPSTC